MHRSYLFWTDLPQLGERWKPRYTCYHVIQRDLHAANEENFNPTERKADGGFIEYLRVGGRAHPDTCILLSTHQKSNAVPFSELFVLAREKHLSQACAIPY